MAFDTTTDLPFETLRAAVDLIDGPITLLDLDGRIRHVNRATERLLGRTVDDLRGASIGVLIAADVPDQVPALLASLLDRGELRAVLSILRPDGTTVPVEVSAEVIRSTDAAPRWVVACVRDLGPQLAQLEQLSGSALSLLAAPGENLLVTIVRVARGLIGARYAALGIVGDGRLVRFVADGMSEAEIAGIKHWPDGHGLLGAVLAERRTIRVADLASDPRHVGFPPGHPVMRSFLGTPIQASGVVYGNLYFTEKYESVEFNLLDERVAELLAAHVAIAIRNQRQRHDLEAVFNKLRRSEHNLAEAQRVAHLGSWEWDLETGTSSWSDETCLIFGIQPGTFGGSIEEFYTFVLPDDLLRVKAAEQAAIEDGVPWTSDYRIIRRDGTVRIVHEVSELVRDEAGHLLRMLGTVEDVTDRRAAEEERVRLAAAIEQTTESVLITKPDGAITFVNPAFERLSGYRLGEILGANPRFLKSGRHDDAFYAEMWRALVAGRTWRGTVVNRAKGGHEYQVEAVISPIRDTAGQIVSYVELGRDVTRERQLESALERGVREREAIESALGRIDPDSSLEEIAAVACAQMLALSGVGSAFVTDLAEDHGQVLAVSGQLAAAFAPGRELPESRAGYLWERASVGPWAEEWQSHPEDDAYGEQVAASGLHTVVYAPLRGPHGVMGVVGFGTHEPAIGAAIVEHLPALRTFASVLGPLLGPGLERRRRTAVERATIQEILDRHAFAPFFQPIVELHDGSVVGFEALSRFTGGQRPDVVFALATRVGLGVELEAACVRAALEAAAHSLPSGAYLSLNASPALIHSGELRPLIVDQDRPIVVEITEHHAIEDYAALRGEVAALGPTVRLAVDDAGAGYASLRHILELHPDFVKLDMGIVRGIDADPARQALVAGVGYFAVKGRIGLIAEGIETEAELETVRTLAVAYAQGYLLGRPRDGWDPGPWQSHVRSPR